MTRELRNYQKAGVNFMLSQPFGKPHALLADAPGTGKTIMAIEAAKQAGCKNGIITCPAVIKEQWRRQMIDWSLAAEDAIQVVYGRDCQIDSRPYKVINYELLREPQIIKQLRAKNWHMLVEDEAHRLKSHRSQQTKAVFNNKTGLAHNCYWKWPMSGSIMPNRPADLYAILATHFPEVLGEYNTWEKFGDRYCGGGWSQYRGAANIAELTARLQPVMLRRELADVWAECPDVIENEVWLDVPFEQHPDWIGAEFLNESAQRRIVAEAKIPQVIDYLKQRLDDGAAKLTVITYHRAMTEAIAKALTAYGAQKIYGGISAKQREISLAEFQQNPQCRLMILQIMSAGEGVDGLQHVCAEYVLAEPEWSPGREDQAGRRILRLGQQSSSVIETKLIAARSFEEIIHRDNLRKQKVIDVVLQPNGGSFTMGIIEQLEARIASLEAKFLFLAPAPTPLPVVPTVPDPLPVAPAPILQAAVAPVPIAAAPVVPAPLPAPAVIPPPAAPAPVAAAAAPAPVGNFGGFPSRKEFEDHVFQKLQSLGVPAGPLKLQAICATFGVEKLHQLPDAHIPNFLQHLAAA